MATQPKRRMRRRPGWVEPDSTLDSTPEPAEPAEPAMTEAQKAAMAPLAAAQSKLKQWQQQYAPELAAKPSISPTSKKVYATGVVIETARARRRQPRANNGNAPVLTQPKIQP